MPSSANTSQVEILDLSRDDPLSATNNIIDTSIKPEHARRLQRDLRIDMVKRLMIKGVTSPPAIQRELLNQRPRVKLSIRTIWSYISLLKKRNAIAIRRKEGLAHTVEETAFELKETFTEILRELWRTYHSTSATPTARVAALKEIRETTTELNKVMQSMGLVYKTPETHQMLDAHGNPTDPSAINIVNHEQMFVQFVKATYQDPLGKEGQPDAIKP